MITTTVLKLHDGERNVVMQFSGVSDGEGNEVNERKVDVSSLTPPCSSVSIRKMMYEVSGGIVELKWDADDPVVFDRLAKTGIVDYSRIGAVINGGGPSATGDILISTLGFDSGSSYSVKLEMIKKY